MRSLFSAVRGWGWHAGALIALFMGFWAWHERAMTNARRAQSQADELRRRDAADEIRQEIAEEIDLAEETLPRSVRALADLMRARPGAF